LDLLGFIRPDRDFSMSCERKNKQSTRVSGCVQNVSRRSSPGLCAASVAEWTRRRAEALAPVVEGIDALRRACRVRCLDETGLRIGGRTQWLHTVAAPTLTLYRACGKRG
jgi:hypothetical protein